MDINSGNEAVTPEADPTEDNQTEVDVAEVVVCILVNVIRETWGSRVSYQFNRYKVSAMAQVSVLARVMGVDEEEAERVLLDGWVDPFEEGAKYWVSHQDGSRILMEARIDSHGVVDLFHKDLDVVLYQVNVGDWPEFSYQKALV